MNEQSNLDSTAALTEQRDDATVDQFAAVMKQTLADARAKGCGGGNIAPRPSYRSCCASKKDDPLDVAYFWMFLWNLGQPIAPASEVRAVGTVRFWNNGAPTIERHGERPPGGTELTVYAPASSARDKEAGSGTRYGQCLFALVAAEAPSRRSMSLPLWLIWTFFMSICAPLFAGKLIPVPESEKLLFWIVMSDPACGATIGETGAGAGAEGELKRLPTTATTRARTAPTIDMINCQPRVAVDAGSLEAAFGCFPPGLLRVMPTPSAFCES